MRLGRVRWWYSEDGGLTWSALEFGRRAGRYGQSEHERLWGKCGEPGRDLGFYGQRRL